VDELVSVLALKLRLAVPIVIVSLAAVILLGYEGQTRAAIFVLTPGLLMDSLARSFFSVFTAYERNELYALTRVVQRFAAAGLGLGALAIGFGVVAVTATYTAGTAIALLLSVALLRRYIGRIPLRLVPGIGRALARRSLPFGAQDFLGVLLARLDAVMLSLLATEAAVGRYGAAYRLLESTFFLTVAITGAFAAMFTYLTHDTEPTIRAAFQRSIKLSLAVMIPLAVGLAVLAEPFAQLVYGRDFASAAPALRLLAPAVVLISLVYLSSSLIVSRGSPTTMVAVVAGMVVLNVGLNLVLIPQYSDRGAATAMLVTELVAAPAVLWIATRRAGGMNWTSVLSGPLLAGAAMSVPMLMLQGTLVAAVAAGGIAYVATLLVLERLISPADLTFISNMIRRRLPSRLAG
jgi:O-antigen/teichoic acid export membrane protein